MNRQQIYDYYSNEFVLGQLVENAKNKEVAGTFLDGAYGQRPNILQYKNDVLQMVKSGVVSFHYSVEHWKNPMAVRPETYEQQRLGWDMILDIDTKLGIEEAKTTVEMILKLLEKYGIKKYGIKFSGRRGFHISLPWMMFPKEIDYKKTEAMYPELPKIIAGFVRKEISETLMKELIRMKSAKELIEMLGEAPESLDPFYFVEVEKDWGNRHMFRAPFSLNEKSWFVSMPIKPGQLKKFLPEDAKPDKISDKTYRDFFSGEENEATDLVMEALDWHAREKKDETKKTEKRYFITDRKISEEHFPPCIKIILSGLDDGRKRSIYTLVNFLRLMNWSWEEIEEKIFDWNSKNRKQLPHSVVLGQLRWNQQNQRTTANCNNNQFYGSIGICRPDDICRKLKNPAAYPFRKAAIKRSRKTSRGFSCGICNREFRTPRGLELHKSKVH
jgi:DNA primase catalytic subunit